MAAAEPVFLAWAGPVRGDADPRLLDAPRAGAAADWPVRADGGAAALACLRDRMAHPGHWRIVLNGGEPPAFLAAVDAGFRRPGDELFLLPPNANAGPDLASLRLAVSGAAPGRCAVLLGAVTPTGALAPLAEAGEICRSGKATLLVDVTLARFSPLPREPVLQPSGYLAALDRWDSAGPGTWGVSGPGDAIPWSAPAPPALLHLDAALRGALADQPRVTLWPLGERRSGVGVVAFAIEDWSAEEASELLRDAFGIVLEAGRLTAAPLPVPVSGSLLRASLAPSSSRDDVLALAGAVSRLASSRVVAPRAH